ncbi:MAG: hypothetical protein Q6351_010725, partial [Candidatus Njordarchaeum guaymaensis]
SIDWWWLDQGDAALINVSKVKSNNGDFQLIKMPKVSIKAAISIFMENLRWTLKIPKKKRLPLIKIIDGEMQKLIEILNYIQEAHSLIDKLEFYKEILNSKTDLEDEQREYLLKVIKGSIRMIIDIFKANPLKWGEKKKLFTNIVSRLDKDLRS